MTTNQKYTIAIIVAIIVVISIIVYRKKISAWMGMSPKRISNVPIINTIVIQCDPNRPGYDLSGMQNSNCISVHPKPSIIMCDELKSKIDIKKKELNQAVLNGNRTLIKVITSQLDKLNRDYTNMGCSG